MGFSGSPLVGKLGFPATFAPSFFAFDLCGSLSLSSEYVRWSSMSKEANAEGNARVRVALGRKIGAGDGESNLFSIALGSSVGFSCAFFAFVANFDRFGSVGDACIGERNGTT
jgi:hypothetical protein